MSMAQAIGAVKTVRSFANERGELSRYSVELKTTLQLKQHQAKAYALYAAVVTALPLLVTTLVIWYCVSSYCRCRWGCNTFPCAQHPNLLRPRVRLLFEDLCAVDLDCNQIR